MDMINEKGIEEIWELLNGIPDPEIPVISIVELGVVRKVELTEGKYIISITPTYSGCPALMAMEESVAEVLKEKGISDFEIKKLLFPPWTTDWLTTESREKLKKYGIAPPERSTEEHLKNLLNGQPKPVTCPFCKSTDTHLTSPFGSTACKALHFCNACRQPFEEFKCH